MFHKVMATALAIGALGGASLAVAQNVVAQPAPPVRAAAVTGDACAPVAFRVYFAPGATRLNGEARAVIDAAARDVAGCDSVEFNLSADPGLVAQAQTRRTASERSVAILAALREKGVEGPVYVAPLGPVVTVAEKNAGPDFIQVAMTPAQAPQRIAENAARGDRGL